MLIALIGAIATIVTGSVLAVLKHYLEKQQRANSESERIRNELRLDLTSARTQITNLTDELEELDQKFDDLREKYWLLFDEYNQYKLTHPPPIS